MDNSPITGIDYKAGVEQYQVEKIFIRILGVYIKSVPGILDTLAAFTEEGLKDYIITVHGLKGASYGVQANRIGDLAKDLEFAGKDENIPFIRDHNQELIDETTQLLGRIEEFLNARA